MTIEFLTALGEIAAAAPPFTGAAPACAGPFWWVAPPGTAEPFCTYFNVGPGLPELFTDGSEIERLRLQFSVFHTNNAAAFTIAGQVRGQLVRASLPVSGTAGRCLAILPAGEIYALPVNPREKSAAGQPVFHVAFDLAFTLSV